MRDDIKFRVSQAAFQLAWQDGPQTLKMFGVAPTRENFWYVLSQELYLEYRREDDESFRDYWRAKECRWVGAVS